MRCVSFKTKGTIVSGVIFYITPVYTIINLIVFQSNHGGFLSTMVAFVYVFSHVSDRMEHLGCSIPDAAQFCRYLRLPDTRYCTGMYPVDIRLLFDCRLNEVCSIFDNSNRYFSTKKCNTKTHFRVDQVFRVLYLGRLCRYTSMRLFVYPWLFIRIATQL